MAKIQKHDAVFVYTGHGILGDDSELRIAIASLRKFCTSWLRDIYVVGEKPNNIEGIKHIPADDPYSHDKDANIIHKLLIASQQKAVSADFLFCSDDQLVTCESAWEDFAPRYVEVYDDPEREYWRGKRENCGRWQQRLVMTMERFGVGAKYFEPHIMCPINKKKFIAMTEAFPWQTENGIMVMSLYNNFAKVQGVKNFDHVSVRYAPFRIPEGVRHVGYFNEAFENESFRRRLETIVSDVQEESDVVPVGVAINVFETTYFLERIIEELRPVVQYICIGYNAHHYGDRRPAPADVLPFCKNLQERGLVDDVLEIKLSRDLPSKTAEREKRNRMAEAIENAGCKYQLVIDSDEFYRREEFLQMWQFLKERDFDASYLRTIDYYRDGQHAIKGLKHRVNFISRAELRFAKVPCDGFIADNTRRLNVKLPNRIVLLPETFRCHHYSYIIPIETKMEYYSQKSLFTYEQDKAIREKIISAWENFDGKTAVLMDGSEHEVEDLAEKDGQAVQQAVQETEIEVAQLSYFGTSPAISLIIPSYNTPEDLFLNCINSVLAQPNHGEMEVIVVDDGATDKTAQILDEMVAAIPHWRVFHISNGGNGAARNFGMQLACGEWLAFLDCDDMLCEDWLQNVLQTLDCADVKESHLNIVQFNNDFVRDGHRRPHNPCESEQLFRFPNQPSNAVFVWAKLYRREFIKQGGFIFPTIDYLKFLFGEDVPTFAEYKKYVRGEDDFFTALTHSAAGLLYHVTWTGVVHIVRRDSLAHATGAVPNVAHAAITMLFAALAIEAHSRQLTDLEIYADAQAERYWKQTDIGKLPPSWTWRYKK